MANVSVMALGSYQTNCYLLRGDHSSDCCIIDPGYHPETILEKLQENGLNPVAILLTHGHFDHVGAVRQLAADLDCPVYIHEKDLSLPPQLTAGPLYYTHTYDEGDVLHLADLDIRVLSTPGHTPGSVCLLTEGILISGDTLFAGTCGRTDLPGGDSQAMQASLNRLSQLEGSLWVLPGHGETSTLEEEKKHNPYMR